MICVFAFTLIVVAVVLALSLPAIAEYYNNQGKSAYDAGKMSVAINNFERAVKLNPNHAIAHYNLGIAYEKNTQYDKAMEEYREAIRADGSLPHLTTALPVCTC